MGEVVPELHFIADEVFERTAVDVAMLAHGLDAEIIRNSGSGTLPDEQN
ncbi:hypothetical protein QUB80_29940 [Chlorogloeopsis sp. ULAP01]|nr:hypothetical protein [Chlorogloeopsis sp. ULAP01]MDM9384883.1 hypothetical protein [Chlorogloeopsis sp. ULAP01]